MAAVGSVPAFAPCFLNRGLSPTIIKESAAAISSCQGAFIGTSIYSQSMRSFFFQVVKRKGLVQTKSVMFSNFLHIKVVSQVSFDGREGQS